MMPQGYAQWHYEAQRRAKRGMKQKKCACHGLWLWADERKGHIIKANRKCGSS